MTPEQGFPTGFRTKRDFRSRNDSEGEDSVNAAAGMRLPEKK